VLLIKATSQRDTERPETVDLRDNNTVHKE